MPHPDEELIAPCGMDCSVCASYLAFTHGVRDRGVRMPTCRGCRPRGKTCAFLKKHCRRLSTGQVRFCFECPTFPCRRLLAIDTRYRTKFHMSLVENLKTIQAKGVERFLEARRVTWACQRCGGLICCHNGLCFHCDLERLQKRTKRYQWEENEKGERR